MNQSRRLTWRVWRAFQSLAVTAWFAYGTLALLQLKLFWNAWQYRDLTSGDTSSYYVSAIQWYEHFRTFMDYSPLYTTFYGSFRFLWGTRIP